MPKFLIVRFSAIGDIVLTTPVIRCLKQQVKGAEVHYATKLSYAAVIENNPFIDKRFYLEDSLSSLADELKRENYDYIIDLHKNLRTIRLRRILGVKSYSFPKWNFQKWLMVNFKINLLPSISIVDRYLMAVKKFGVVNDGKGLEHFITQKDGEAVGRIPPEFQSYVAFVIGATYNTKRFPDDKVAAVILKLNKPVVLLGGTQDYSRGNNIIELVQQTSPQKDVYNSCGKFSLNESAAIIKSASAVITNDTGLMHIAAAYKKRIVSLWGNTIPQFGMFPYFGSQPHEHMVAEITGLSCRPCSKLGYAKCPRGHFKCMREIDVEEVVRFASL